jgi:signal transduction histidine kinase
LKLRLFLVFVIVYIIAVFGWWLYSFINYTEKEYKLEYNNLKLNSFVIHNQINEYIDKLQGSETQSPYSIYKKHVKEVNSLHESLNKGYNINTSLSIVDSNGNLYNLLKIDISPEEFKSIHKTFIKKQRAFYSEVIFFTILIISGVVWVFGKLESLLNLNKMQNNFLLSVTHELKTPLTAIKLSSQTLQHRKIDAEIQNTLIQQIVNNSDRLNELLDNVLLATRIDGKSYNYNMSMVDLTELIHKTADLVLCQPNFTGQFIFHEQERRILGDEISLKLVFSNLFQNAIKYAGNNSLITVSYIYENGQLNVAVSDNGRGIDPKEYKSIFMKFYRVGDENTRENKGTGLGLFLVKQILKSHNANIRAEANIPQGTTFYITFK